MTDKRYNPKEFALELGFSEDDAERFGAVNANATNLRRLAKTRRAKGKMPDQKGIGKVAETATGSTDRKAKERAKAEAETAKAAAEAETEAENRPSFLGQDNPPSPETEQSLTEVAKEVGETVPPADV